MNYPLQSDPYAHLRQIVDPRFAMLPAAQLRAQIDGSFGEGSADAMEADFENIFGSIGHAISSAARDVGHFAQRNAGGLAQIGGGVIQGAMAGSAAGLPGIIAGAALGGTGAGLRTYGSGAARDVGNALGTVTNLAGQFSPLGRVGATLGPAVGNIGGAFATGGGRGGVAALGQALPGLVSGIAGGIGGGGMGGRLGSGLGALGGLMGGGQQGRAPGGMGGVASGLLGAAPQIAGALSGLFGGNSAAGQLASAMNRPEIQQALGAMRLGPMGRPTIPVGSAQTPVPTGQFAQLLSQLMGVAAHEWAESAGAEAEAAEVSFMTDSADNFFGDPANPADRAAHLWALLNAAQSERFADAIEAVGWEAQYDGAVSDFYAASEADSYDADALYWDSIDQAEADALNEQLDSDYALEGMEYA
ncbi:hypothetical protein [Sphingomonas jaspsi]|uniref:hypothetical protein n=1 Tax=Sphingomonas jaspsi TaxID=392409 RepID=UPI0004B9D8F3|nr:hypothetical protein [Sphingomonas jaspsi]